MKDALIFPAAEGGIMTGLIGRIFLSATAAVFLWFAPMAAAAPQAETDAPPPAAESAEIQKVINILQDDQKRGDMITLLKLLATLDQERAREIINGAESGGTDQTRAAAEPGSVEAALSGLAERAWRNIGSTGAGLRQSWREARNVFDALRSPLGVEMWRPYLLKIFIWGLVCLLGVFFIVKKFGGLPETCPDQPFNERLKMAVKYVLTVAGPSLALIVSLLAIPGLSSTAPGVTADMALGFSLIQSFVQHFFINLSALYIFLEMVKTIFTPGSGGRSVAGLHPVLSRHLMRSLRVLAIYLAVLVFFKETFMEHFAGGSLFLVLTIALTLPIPAYLTARLTRFSRLVHAVGEAEASAAMDEEEPAGPEDDLDAPPRPRLDYQADLMFKKHWAAIAVLAVWGLWFLFLFNPMDTGIHYAVRLLVSLMLAGLAALGLVLTRQALLRFISQDSDNGRRLLLHVDLLLNVLMWPTLAAVVIVLWGAPLSRLLESDVARDILGRALAIALVAVALVVFVKFSRAATEWLLSSPDLSRNRNWRTITPLVLTAVRALAVFTGLVVILERLGVNVGPILAGAGILGLGVGMGAQSLVKDLINGVSILLADTLAVGEYVAIGGKSGTVESVGLRSIRLRDVSGNLTVVPNSLVDTIVNMTRDYSQDIVEFNVPYDADPDAMLRMAREVADELSRDRDWRDRLTDPVSVVGITAFDSDGTTIRMKLNTTAGDQWSVGRELRLRLKRRMLREGITSTWYGRNIVYFKQHEEDEAAGPPAEPASS